MNWAGLVLPYWWTSLMTLKISRLVTQDTSELGSLGYCAVSKFIMLR